MMNGWSKKLIKIRRKVTQNSIHSICSLCYPYWVQIYFDTWKSSLRYWISNRYAAWKNWTWNFLWQTCNILKYWKFVFWSISTSRIHFQHFPAKAFEKKIYFILDSYIPPYFYDMLIFFQKWFNFISINFFETIKHSTI